MAAQSIKSLFYFCFCEAFIKNLMKKKTTYFCNKNFQNSIQDVLCYGMLGYRICCY